MGLFFLYIYLDFSMNEIQHYKLYDTLQRYAETIINNYKDKLKAEGHVATGNLIDSLDWEIRNEDDDIVVYLNIEQYAGALEYGRKPTSNGNDGGPTLHDKIVEWLRVKGIQPENERSLPTEQAFESMAWAITTKIHKEGTALYKTGGGHYLEDTIREVWDQFEQQIYDAIDEDVSSYVISEVNEIIGNLSF